MLMAKMGVLTPEEAGKKAREAVARWQAKRGRAGIEARRAKPEPEVPAVVGQKAGGPAPAATAAGKELEFFEAAVKGHAQLMKDMVERGADVNARDADECTALMRAAQNGHTDAVKFLLSAHAEVDARDKYGWTPLMYAVKNGDTEIARILIAQGAELGARNIAGFTPLVIALKKRDSTMENILRRAGATE